MLGIFCNTGITALLLGATFPAGCTAAERKAEERMASDSNAGANKRQDAKEAKEHASLELTK